MSKNREAVRVGGSPVTPITANERRRIDKAIKKKYAGFRRKYPEIHGKVVDFVTNSIEDGMLYLSVCFTDKTECSLR